MEIIQLLQGSYHFKSFIQSPIFKEFGVILKNIIIIDNRSVSGQMQVNHRKNQKKNNTSLKQHGNKPSVAIIILNWNGWKDTIECLESLYQIDYPLQSDQVCCHTSEISAKLLSSYEEEKCNYIFYSNIL